MSDSYENEISIEEKAKQEISQLLQGKEYRVIYIPGRIINFVLKDKL